MDGSQQNWEAERWVQVNLSEALKREECIWKQKSRVSWYTTADLNTKFFHLSTIIRRRRNNIESIKDGHGRWLRDRVAIGSHVEEYFRKLFTSEFAGIDDEISELIQPTITTDNNMQLCEIPWRKRLRQR